MQKKTKQSHGSLSGMEGGRGCAEPRYTRRYRNLLGTSAFRRLIPDACKSLEV